MKIISRGLLKIAILSGACIALVSCSQADLAAWNKGLENFNQNQAINNANFSSPTPRFNPYAKIQTTGNPNFRVNGYGEAYTNDHNGGGWQREPSLDQ